jgi:hypothetical protein
VQIQPINNQNDAEKDDKKVEKVVPEVIEKVTITKQGLTDKKRRNLNEPLLSRTQKSISTKQPAPKEVK